MVLLILEDGKHERGESRSWIQSGPGFKGTNKGDRMKSICFGGAMPSSYQVVESRGYVYGMIPLIMDGVCMTAFLTACRICR